jgi:hypothetical protein
LPAGTALLSVPLIACWTQMGVANAQVPGSLPNPDLQNRIPAPLPPPTPPPIINGPLGQGPPPGVYLPPRLSTFSDRAAACAHQGAAQGLRGRKLNAYTRACANP